MAEVDDIRRLIDGKPAWNGDTTRKKRQRPARTQSSSSAPTKSKQPTASERSSVVAQHWFDQGVERGFTFPYNVNFLALAIQQRVETDPRMQKLLAADRADDVSRWLERMVSNWWDFYADEEITSSNAKDYFLGHDWEDLRDWALDNLKSEYRIKHGKRVAPPIYPNQQEYQQRLEDIRKRHSIETYLKKDAEEPDDTEPPKVDEEGRQRLRSWAERHKQRRQDRGNGR